MPQRWIKLTAPKRICELAPLLLSRCAAMTRSRICRTALRALRLALQVTAQPLKLREDPRLTGNGEET